MKEHTLQHCCERFRDAAEGADAQFVDATGSWKVTGCCGGGCYVVEDMVFCPFCGKSLRRSVRDMEIPTLNRDDYIHACVRESLESLAQDALYWDETPPLALKVEPLWYELRDAITSVLFDLDREQLEHEQYAAHVVKECL